MGRHKKSVKLLREKLQYASFNDQNNYGEELHWKTQNKSNELPPSVKRFDQRNHFPARVLKTRARPCQHANCDKLSSVRCLKCDVYLCLGTKKETNCYYLFHLEACKENELPVVEEKQQQVDDEMDVDVQPVNEKEPDAELLIVEVPDPLQVAEKLVKINSTSNTISKSLQPHV